MSEDIHSKVKELAGSLSKKGLTLSLAESCTGGKIASLITDLPGASAFFKGSAVVYSNEAKQTQLNVSEDTIKEHGAVSLDTAMEMAKGAREAFASSIAASATGIAGPDGGTEDKPVGTVFIAVADGGSGKCRELKLNGTREEIRNKTVKAVIEMLISVVAEK